LAAAVAAGAATLATADLVMRRGVLGLEVAFFGAGSG
jgi:hypothetical protein